MRFRKSCEHDRYDQHPFVTDNDEWESCPGGEFLPEGALVIEKEGLRRRVGEVLIRHFSPPSPVVFVDATDDLLDALAFQVGESE